MEDEDVKGETAKTQNITTNSEAQKSRVLNCLPQMKGQNTSGNLTNFGSSLDISTVLM